MQETIVPVNNRPPVQSNTQHKNPHSNISDIERVGSIVGGGALTITGLSRLPSGLLPALIGSYLLYRGIGGHCPLYSALGIDTSNSANSAAVHIERSVTINREPAELFRFWRDFNNLPRIMKHLESVTVYDQRRSHWVAKAPLDQRVEWDAEVVRELPDRMIAWRSTRDAQVPNGGSVHFTPAPGGRGTELRVVLVYWPPAGKLGRAIAMMLGEEPTVQMEDDLRRFKMQMEAGEVATGERLIAKEHS
jgi:uncharacterized membrane protein